MGLLAAGQAEMAEAVASWSRLRSRIAMIDSLALAREVPPQNNEYPAVLHMRGGPRVAIRPRLGGRLLRTSDVVE
jgi:hypothetical protein